MATKTRKKNTVKVKAGMTTQSKKTTSKSTKKDASPAVAPPSYEVIAERAWCIWMDRGCHPGQDEQNWLEAVAQLETELVLC